MKMWGWAQTYHCPPIIKKSGPLTPPPPFPTPYPMIYYHKTFKKTTINLQYYAYSYIRNSLLLS